MQYDNFLSDLLFILADGQSNNLRSFGIEIQNIEAADHGWWSVSVDLKDVLAPVTLDFHVTVALPPNEINLESNSLQVHTKNLEH